MVIGKEAEPAKRCSSCNKKLTTEVQHSNAGYYIGTFCDWCGPEGRESDYFHSRVAAEAELALWKSTNVKPHARTPGFTGEDFPI